MGETGSTGATGMIGSTGATGAAGSFQNRFSATSVGQTINLSDSEVPYATIDINDGAVFDGTRFTAPVNGTYMFHGSATFENSVPAELGAQNIRLVFQIIPFGGPTGLTSYIVENRIVPGGSPQGTPVQSFMGNTIHMMRTLNAGDQISVRYFSVFPSNILLYGFFIGYQI